MKLHILGNPGLPTGEINRTDYFSYDCYKFIKHLNKEFEMIHYGLSGSDVECQHHDIPKGQEGMVMANTLIKENKEKGDMILCFYGADNHPATIGHEDLKIIEPHIGYRPEAVFAPYRVFVSYAQMHYYYGLHKKMDSPSWFDRVIPNSIDPDEFYLSEKKDYALILGRVQDDKGINVAIQATERAGMKLVIAGTPQSLKHLHYDKVPSHVELVGHVDVTQRAKLLSEAVVLLAPTYYLEPFGMMVIEAMASGTPVVSSAWGAFPEFPREGIYPCRSMSDFVCGLEINQHGFMSYSQKLREVALRKYSDKVVYSQYIDYLKYVAEGDFYGRGETITPEATTTTTQEEIVSEMGLKQFSIIIPTMGKSMGEFTDMLYKYEECPLVGEVLVVDNSDAGINETGGKDRIIYSGPNIYVNPAWNMGVKEAKYDNIILANDDIIINNLNETLELLSGYLKEGMIIGVSANSGSEFLLTPGHYIGRSWGEFLAVKKASYVPIPEDIKIWYGDNYLVNHLESHTLFGIDGEFGKSATMNSRDFSEICEADREAYLKTTKRPGILHVVMSCNRPEYLRQAVASWGKLNMTNTTTKSLIIDDMPNSRNDMEMYKEFHSYFDKILLNEVNKGLSVVWKELWERDLSGYDYILHQEDDVVVVEEVRVFNMIRILKEDPTLCAVTLMRQKWYDREEETIAKPTDEVKYGYRIEYRSEVFSPMFTLYRTDITKLPIAQHYGQENLNEGMIMRYLETMGFRVAYLKSSSGGPLIHHIGEYKTGKIVSEGEPGYENFANFDPMKKYCSKTGKEL